MARPHELEPQSGTRRTCPPGQPRRRSLSIVIPVHNEASILDSTIMTISRGLERLALDWWELIICENGSSDATLRIAEALAIHTPSVKVISRNEADYGAAMRAGFLAARGDVIANFDADYYDLEFVERALQEQCDIVVAAKSLKESEDTRTILRRLASRTFGWTVRGLLGLHVSETHGMKLWDRAATQHLAAQVRSTKDLFDTELIARAEWAGLVIVELPIRTIEMRHSRSGILRRVPRTMWGLVSIRLRGVRANPVVEQTTLGASDDPDAAASAGADDVPVPLPHV